MSKFKAACASFKTACVKHSPEILTGIGIAGMLTTTVMAVKATPKALQLIEDEKEYLDVDELTPIETVKVAWKPYIPAAVTCVASVGCLIGASATNVKRNAALATAYKISETALAEYKEKVVETIGEKKEKAIREEIERDHLRENPVSKNQVIITGKGTSLCYDPFNDRYFDSDMETIRRAINRLNHTMMTDMAMCASLNDFYDELGLSHTNIGDSIGWKIDWGLIEEDIHALVADDGRPCLVLGFKEDPKYGFAKFS